MLYSHMLQLYTHIIHIPMHAEYILTQWIRRAKSSLKKYTSHFIWKVVCVRGSWRPNRTATYWSPLSWPSVLCLSRSPDAQLESQGLSSLLDDGFLYRILSLTHLISNSIGGPKGPFCRVVAFPTTSCLQLVWSPIHWLPVYTELYNSSIAHSIFGMACLIVIKRK